MSSATGGVPHSIPEESLNSCGARLWDGAAAEAALSIVGSLRQ